RGRKSRKPLEHFSSLKAVLEPHSLLHSGSSSPVNSENCMISSGSDHLGSLRVSPPLPLMLPGLQVEGVKLDTDACLKQNPLNTFTNASSAQVEGPPQAEGPVVGCWSTDPIWPGWDTLALNKPKFCIEREAQLHKQAAGTVTLATLLNRTGGSITLKLTKTFLLKKLLATAQKLKAAVL
ncbi:hypothetical protein cypCar_00036085, partial [Cyprinus carpio]